MHSWGQGIFIKHRAMRSPRGLDLEQVEQLLWDGRSENQAEQIMALMDHNKIGRIDFFEVRPTTYFMSVTSPI